MNIDDKIISLAKKLKALADGGVGGERATAAEFLKKLLIDNNLTIDDLIGEVKKRRDFKLKNKEHRMFFYQIVANVTGNTNNIFYWPNQGGIKIQRVELTDIEYLEIINKMDFFWRVYKQEQKLFYSAFVQKNKLYAKPNGKAEDKELTVEELEEMERVRDMMRGIKQHTFLQQIEQ